MRGFADKLSEAGSPGPCSFGRLVLGGAGVRLRCLHDPRVRRSVVGIGRKS